jgi:hypothetical protein
LPDTEKMPTVGIMTLYTGKNRIVPEEMVYFQKVSKQGSQMGVKVIVFTPEDVNHSEKQIRARWYDTASGSWKIGWRSFPDLIYDRCRYQATVKFQKFKQFRAKYDQLIYLNRPLANKLAIHQALSKHTRIRNHLPATKRYSPADLQTMLRSRSLLYLKPINGTGGRGILRLEKLGQGLVRIQGRDRNRRLIPSRVISERLLPQKLAAWGVDSKYLIQQGIHLRLKDGRVHDYRLLIQKTATGEWDVTGCSGRVGPLRSVTSNLHGGGKALPMKLLLKQRYGSEEKAESIRREVYQLSQDIADFLEGEYGKLCELGLDIAIDPDGHPWLLEINPKPAREVFRRIGEKDTYVKAIRRPLEYALWLYRQKKRKAGDAN